MLLRRHNHKNMYLNKSSINLIRIAKFSSVFIFLINITLINCFIDTEICDLNDGRMYCKCDNEDENEAINIHCLVFNLTGLTNESSVWNGFDQQQNTEYLSFSCRTDAQLPFVPRVAINKIATKLRRLDFKEANLGALDSYSFSNLSKLQEITLDRNEITSLSPKTLFNLQDLTKLGLSENHLTEIQADVFVLLPKLTELFLDRNRITRVQDNAFEHLEKLRELELWRNSIGSVNPNTFKGLSSLQNLDLFSNKLQILVDNTFRYTPKLHVLNLNENEIEAIEDHAFDGLHRLLNLKLNKNRLTTLSPPVFKNVPNLVMVDLSENSLASMDQELVDNIQKSKEEPFLMYLSDNPWVCKCSILWMATILPTVTSVLFTKELQNVKCRTSHEFPFNLTQKEIKIHNLAFRTEVAAACSQNPDGRITHSSSIVNSHSRDEDGHVTTSRNHGAYLVTESSRRPMESESEDNSVRRVAETEDSTANLPSNLHLQKDSFHQKESEKMDNVIASEANFAFMSKRMNYAFLAAAFFSELLFMHAFWY